MPNVPIYQQQRGLQGQGPQNVVVAQPTQNVAAAGQQGAMLQSLGEMGMQAAGRIAERDSYINKSNAVRAFKEQAQALTEEFASQDITNQEVLRKYNSSLREAQSLAVRGFSGTMEDRVSLEAGLENTLSSLGLSAVSQHRAAVIDRVKSDYGDAVRPLLEQIYNGELEPGVAFTELRNINNAIGGKLPFIDQQTFYESAQNQVALSSVQRHLDAGDWKAARGEIDANPFFADMVQDQQLVGLVRKIGEMESNETKQLQAKRVELQGLANQAGYGSWDEVPQAIKMAHTFGIKPQAEQTPLSDVGRVIYDRQLMVGQYGEGSPAVAAFDQAAQMAQAADSASGIVPLIQQRDIRISELQAQGATLEQIAGDETVRTVQAEIDAKDPVYQERKARLDALPRATNALQSYIDQKQRLTQNAELALMAMTGTSNIEDAKIAVDNGNFAWGIGDMLQVAGSIMPGSTVNTVDGYLNPLRGSALINALSDLKSNSPTGGSGLGALSNQEGQRLEAMQGSLSLDAPMPTARTLIEFIQDAEGEIQEKIDLFNADFEGYIQQPISMGGNRGNGGPVVSGGRPVYGADGNPIR